MTPWLTLLLSFASLQGSTPNHATVPGGIPAPIPGALPAQWPDSGGFPGLPANHTPKVEIAWNRLDDTDSLYALFDRLAAAYPNLMTMQVIGHSTENREMRVYTLTNVAKGADTEKPAMWIDGNVHGNEVQGGEACLYLVWWLCENRDRLPRVRDLLERTTFYVAPTINPDGRARWFDEPGTMHSSRGGSRPVDNDRDGRFDEDPADDLDGDGELLEMRVESPDGNLKADPYDPRLMVRCEPDERGTWRMIGIEGKDDDGEG